MQKHDSWRFRSTPPQLLGPARQEEEALWAWPLLATRPVVPLLTLVCAWGEVPVEAERGKTQREARQMASEGGCQHLGACHGCSVPG
jgi:hypothetical protein